MTPVAVVTDTTHYLPADLVARHDLHLVSLYVRWGGEQLRESEMEDFGAFYERLRSARELPTTSQPSIGDFVAVLEPLVAAGRDVLSVHISAGISGTHDAALQAKAQLEERGHPGRIEVVDSGSGCGGLGFVALAACARARAGGSLSEVAAQARDARDHMKVWFAVDTLEYLRRGGRIGAAQAWIGGALKIKPILSIESEIAPIERVRTSGKAFERLVEFMRSLAAEGANAWIVQHVQAAEQAERLVERGREVFGTEPVCVSEIGPVIGTHVGPGLIGVGAVPAHYLS
ncbi:MAG TPA: DegV family protein [Solirubrobacteraceae bacterium]|jgi:DegV family protein with EDD domain|nr:DegV family protein [Solirubrobacteraceae bacterium]